MKKLSTLLCAIVCVFAWAQTVINSGASAKTVKDKTARAATSQSANYPTVWVLGELGIPQEDGTENQVGYRPDLGIKMATTDGNIYTATVHFFNIAGDPIHNFGFCTGETLADNPGGWDVINDYRIGASEPETAVYFDQPLKIGEQGVSKENFFKIATGTYLLTLNLANKTLTTHPTTDYSHLFIMGNGVKGQENAANAGTEFITADGKNFKKQITFEATSGSNATFTFSTKLGANADDWDAIAANRFGAITDNTAVELNKEIAFGGLGNSKDNRFTIPAGTYEMSVNTETMTMKVTSQQFPPLYVMGRIAGQVWAANQGTAMETKDGNIYTLQAVFQKAEDKAEATFGFTTKLAGSFDWNQIADYRIGYTDSYGDTGYPVLYGKKMKLGQQGPASKENFFAVQDGEYKITVNLAERTCTVEPVGKTYDKLYIMGRTSSVDAEGSKKYQAWAADQGTEIYTHDFNNYVGQITFEDDLNSSNVGFSFTTKLGADFTKWDDIANNRFGAQNANTNVNLGNAMQCGDFLTSKENQFIIPIGTYDVSMNLSTRTLLVSKTPYTPLYILGRVAYDKDGAWYRQPCSSKQGFQLETQDGVTYTGKVAVEDDLGSAYTKVGFSTKLSFNEGEWDAISGNRFAAMTNGGEYLPFNTETQCGDYLTSKENFFQVRRGEYSFTVNLPKRTVKIEPTSDPVIYIIGMTKGKDFVANDGLAIHTNDGKTYSGEVTFEGQDAQFVLSDKLSTTPDGWTDIEKYTFGPEQDQTSITEKAPATFGPYTNAWVVSPKTYKVVIDLPNNTLLLDEPDAPTSINTNKDEKGISVYPTLTSGYITVESKTPIYNIEVYSTTGESVYHKSNENGNQVTVNLNNQPAGIYFLKVNSDYVVKIVKK